MMADDPSYRGAGQARWRPALAALALLTLYVTLSFTLDPRGFLGTDTGGKVATLVAMERSDSLSPDVGYWAEQWDPAGRNHPLWFTSRLDGKWVNVTTLPMLYAGYPLYRLGGYRLTLLWPMLGAVAAAFAVSALVRRMQPDAAWPAFWLVGVASPIAIYALDFWEHAPGAALMVWGVVLALDAAHKGRPLLRGCASGVCFGLAATMRTEALVYGAVTLGLLAGWMLWRSRRVLPATFLAGGVGAAMSAVFLANAVLERVVLGTAFRAARTAGAAEAAGASAGAGGFGDVDLQRWSEAFITSVALFPAQEAIGWLVGGLLVALIGYVVRGAVHGRDQGLLMVASLGVVALYASRLAGGLGFVPGLFPAAPLAVVGLALGWRHERARPVLGIAVVALPVVWALQFTGGAGPQWGGRYLLTSSLLLVGAGVALAVAMLPRWVTGGLVVLSLAVTVFGVSWLAVRSHDISRTFEELHERREPVLVSAVAHLPREGGAVQHQRRWLTATTRRDLEHAAEVVRSAGHERFALVELAGEREGAVPVPGWEAGERDVVRLFAGTDLWVTPYEVSVP